MSGPFGSSSFNHLISSGFYNDAVTRSARFADSSNAYLQGNKSANGDRKTFTIAWWMKMANQAQGTIYTSGWSGSGGSQDSGYIIFSNNTLKVAQQDNNSDTWAVSSAAVFHDCTNWYHIICAVDTTQSTAGNRVKLYINGLQQTVTGTQPDQDLDTRLNNQYERIASWDDGGSRYFDFDGYLADYIVVDGSQLDASSFGEFKDGVFIPIDFSGSFGTKGWRLQFKQTGDGQTTASSSTIGADTSGNDFHFNDYNMDTYDSNMPDCPENNFCTMNINHRGNGDVSHKRGALDVTKSSSNFANMMGTHCLFSGKWYFEMRVQNSNLTQVGVQESINNIYNSSGNFGANTDLGMWDSRGYYYDEGTAAGSPGTFTTNDIIGVAFDVEAGKIWFAKDNTYQHSGDPAGGSNQTTGSTNDLSSIGLLPAFNGENSGNGIFNFGQDSSFYGNETAQTNTDGNGYGNFFYEPPSGFLAICSQNLATPSIGPSQPTQANDHFNSILYTGDASSTRAITGVGFKPDLVSIAQRNNTSAKVWYDSSRGVNKMIQSTSTAAEDDSSQYGYLSVFGTDGFTAQAGTTNNNYINENSVNIVAWNWKANGGVTSSNTNGNTTSTVQANDDAGFSIALYTGDGNLSTVGHGLSAAPDIVILKNRSSSPNGQWVINSSAVGFNGQMYLNDAGAFSTNSGSFNDTAPSSTVVTINTDNTTNESTDSFVMYSWRRIPGYSHFGVYRGNGSATDGPCVHCGFRPQWVMVKMHDGSGSFTIYDNARDTVGINSLRTSWNSSAAEGDSTSQAIVPFSDGFELFSNNSDMNASGSDYMFMAFAETPFKFNNAFASHSE